MTVWIALLRGVNVGGKNRLPMSALTRVMTDNGFEDVRTYIQSGNIVFRSAQRPKGQLALLVEQHFGFRPEIVYLSHEELASAVQRNPFQPEEGKQLHYFFLAGSPVVFDTAPLDAVKSKREDFRRVGNVFYLYAPDGIGRSKLAEKVGRALAGSATARNANTVARLLQMAAECGRTEH